MGNPNNMSHSQFIIRNSSFACLRATHRQAAGVGIPFETKMTDMSQKLYGQMEESAKLDAIIRQWVSFYLVEPGNWATACCPIELPPETPATIPSSKGKQPVAQLQSDSALRQLITLITAIPWGHNIAIISKCSTIKEALYYVRQTITHGWSRAVLTHQMESGLHQREGSAITNFSETLPPIQSDLAQQTLKDPYLFDFLALSANYNERDLENQLTEHITRFLLELGAGFAYLGRQVPLQVGERDFSLDLLFYHTQLHCYVVIELKTGEFEPEFAGKLNFYIKAVDELKRIEGDAPTIGILLCKKRDRLVAEYALSDINKPIGVSEYQLTQSLPEELKSRLPSVDQLESELSENFLNDES
jgi:predicted nuclease of restriction endonuclease-like (RecB) superfamily